MTGPQRLTAGLDAGERRLAARHLLASPILTAVRQPAELDLVRRHAPALKSMFASQLGYALVVESRFARLVKAPLPASAPVARPAVGPTTPLHGPPPMSSCAGLRRAARAGRGRADPHLRARRPDPGRRRRAVDHGHRRDQRPAAARHRAQAAGGLGGGDRDRRFAHRLE